MLSDLIIRDFILIDNLEIHFGSGLNILTGETGAGKTIILEALSFVLGERSSVDVIRREQDQTSVEALFELKPNSIPAIKVQSVLADAGLDWDDNLILKRQLTRNGKNRCFINNSPCTVKILSEVGSFLVDLHGQHEHQALLNPSRYLDFLDNFAGLSPKTNEFTSLYNRWRTKIQEQAALLRESQMKNRELDQIRFQIEDISRANLTIGEEEDLLNERQRLRNFQFLFEKATQAFQLLEGSEEFPGLLQQVGNLQSHLDDLVEKDSSLQSVIMLAANVDTALVEIQSSIQKYLENLQAEPGRLEDVEARLHQIQLLKKKYGDSIQEILAFADKSKASLAKIENSDLILEQLSEEIQGLATQLVALGKQISRIRHQKATKISHEITQELTELGMKSAHFQALVITQSGADSIAGNSLEVDDIGVVHVTPFGWDRVDFLLTANPGEPPRTLSQVASGGEISRVMLAIKSIFSRVDSVDVLVFDEIDTGIGGNTAHMVGNKIKQLAQYRQVIAITHLPMIAARADDHFVIRKTEQRGGSSISLQPIKGQQKIEELARMMGTGTLEEGLKLVEEILMKNESLSPGKKST